MIGTRAAFAAAALLLGAPLRAERLETTTTYPAPSGAYDTMHSRQYRFISYATRAEMNVAPMPNPGTFVYCSETGSYYASSPNAVAADPLTWWYRVELDDTPENIFAQGSLDTFSQPNNSYAWAKPPTVTTGYLYYYNYFIRSNLKITSAGSYTASATGKVCQIRPTGSTTFRGINNSVVFRLRLRLNGTYVGDQTAFTLTPAADQEADCAFDPADIAPVPNPAPVCYCSPFSLSGSLSLAVGNQPYVGLLSYGTKTTLTWNNARGYGGYVVHIEDMKIFR